MNEINENQNKSLFEKIKTPAIELLQSLTTHSLPNVFRAKYLSIRLFWIILFLASAIASIIFIIQTVESYLEFNVSTEVRLLEANEFEFPIITICDKNSFSTEMLINFFNEDLLKEYNKTIQDIINGSDETEKSELEDFLKKQKDDNQKDKMLVKNIISYESDELIRLIKFEEKIKECKFNNKNENCTFEFTKNSKYGPCYRFNSNINQMKKTKKIGPEYGLEITFFQDDKYDPLLWHLGLENALYISIDKKNTNPYNDFDDLIDLSYGNEVQIALDESLFVKQPKPHSDCDFKDEDEAKAKKLDSKYYNQLIKSNYSYSQKLCIDFCKNDKCIDLRTNIRVPNIARCLDNKTEDNNSLDELCLKECPLECTKTKYSYRLKTSRISQFYAENYNRSLSRDNFLNLKIYYSSMSYIQYKESAAMTGFSLLSNLGGVLGLFLGNFFLFLYSSCRRRLENIIKF